MCGSFGVTVKRFYGVSVTNKLTNLLTSGPIKIIDKKTRGQPNMKLDGHLSKNIFIEGVLINVITPLTIRAVLNDIKNAKITILYCLGSFFILFALPR
jgi:hypothetical protein